VVRFRIWSSIVFHAEAGPLGPEDAVQMASSSKSISVFSKSPSFVTW